MYKENVYAKMEKLEAQICRYTRQGLKVMPWSMQLAYSKVLNLVKVTNF